MIAEPDTVTLAAPMDNVDTPVMVPLPLQRAGADLREAALHHKC
jgi:hypothetical protein